METIAIVFGGKSGEHEVSVKSALSIEASIDHQLYQTFALGISHQGKWIIGQNIADIVNQGKVIENQTSTQLPPQELFGADVAFVILHGPNGEDGTIQGLFEVLDIPYTGPGVLGSAASMDKVVQKQLCHQAGIPQVKYQFFNRLDWQNSQNEIINKLTKLNYPLFIKPVNMGSSVGVSKVKNQTQLKTAIQTALKYDHKVIAEEGVEPAIEIEVSVLGNETPQASLCGSIEPNTEFYDYETKYITDDIEAKIPAKLPTKVSEKIRQTAVEAFKIMNCQGLARVDFLYHEDKQQFFLNELNTLPGFTSISMYPKLWEATNLPYTQLITKIIQLGQERHRAKQKISYEYQP